MLSKQRPLVHNDAMQRTVLVLLLAISTTAAEWQPLFNGRDLSGWTNVNCAFNLVGARRDGHFHWPSDRRASDVA